MKKWVEIILSILLGLLLLFRGAELWVGAKIKKIATTELYRASDGVYKLDIGRVSVGLFDRSVKIKTVSVLTDSLQLDQLVIAERALPEAERRRMSGLKLSIAELFIKGIWFNRHSGDIPADTASNIVESSLHQDLRNTFDRLTVGRIRMRGVDGEYSMRKGDDTLRYIIRRTTVEADDYDLNSDPLQHPLNFQDIRLTIRRLEHICMYGAMTMRADTLTVSTARGSVGLGSLSVNPNYEKTEFAGRNPKHRDWTFYKLSAITASGIDFTSLAYRRHLAADSISIGRLDAGSYKDRNVERTEWVKSMFYESLRKLPVTVDVKSVKVMDGTAFYEELPEGGQRSATIRFSDLSATISDLSNMADPPAEHITVDAASMIMGAGELKVSFLAPAGRSGSRFEITGSLGPVDMAVFNPLTEPLANIRIDAGRINGIDFRVTGGASTSRVEMTMLYENLYATMMEEDSTGYTRDRKFLSSLANGMVLRESNPDGRGKLHRGSGTAERDIYRSQYNYMWKSLLPGIVESVDIPKGLIHQNTAGTARKADETPDRDSKTSHRGIIPALFKPKTR